MFRFRIVWTGQQLCHTRTAPNDSNQYLARVDHLLTSKLQLSGHYVYNGVNDTPPTTNPNFFIKQNNKDQNATVHLTDTVSPSTILDVQFGYNLFKQFVNKNLANTTPDIARDILKINGVASDTRASDAPTFITPGFGTLGGFHFGPRQWFSERYETQASASLVRGKHLIRAGMHVVRHHETFPEIFIGNGLYVFDGSMTGYSMADMLIGIPRILSSRRNCSTLNTASGSLCLGSRMTGGSPPS
jgi:hypothetical protein